MMRYKSPDKKTDHPGGRYLVRWSPGVAPSTDTGYLIIWPQDDKYMRGDDEQHQKKTD